jgi:hypothetical protein
LSSGSIVGGGKGAGGGDDGAAGAGAPGCSAPDSACGAAGAACARSALGCGGATGNAASGIGAASKSVKIKGMRRRVSQHSPDSSIEIGIRDASSSGAYRWDTT